MVLGVYWTRNDNWAEISQARYACSRFTRCGGNILSMLQRIFSNKIKSRSHRAGCLPDREQEEKQAFPQRIYSQTHLFFKSRTVSCREQVTIYNLITKMNEYLSDSGETAYSWKYMKKKLEEHFGSFFYIVITNINGQTNLVTLKITATHILQDFHEQQNNAVNDRTKAENIVKPQQNL